MNSKELRSKILAKRSERIAAQHVAMVDDGLGLDDEDFGLGDDAPVEEELEQKVVQAIKFDIVYDVTLNGGRGDVAPNTLDDDGRKALDVLFVNVSTVMNEISQQPSQIDKITGNFAQTLTKNIEKAGGKRNALVRTQVKLTGSADADSCTARMNCVAMLTTFVVGDDGLARFQSVVEDAFRNTRFNCSQAIKRQVRKIYEDQVKANRGIPGVKSVDIAFKDVVNFDAAEPQTSTAVVNNVILKRLASRAVRLAELEYTEVVDVAPLFTRDELLNNVVDPGFMLDDVDYLSEDPATAWDALAAAGFTSGDEAVLPAGASIVDEEPLGSVSLYTFEHNGHVLSIDLDEECADYFA